MGGALAAIGELTSHASQREKEAQLLFIGQQYRQAIASYYERSPGGAKRYPQKLDDLLEDKRYPNTQRHLRRLYPDPLTGQDWGLMEAPGGGIMGVYSRSETAPIKTGAFAKADQTFADARSYGDWKFFYIVDNGGSVPPPDQKPGAETPPAPNGLPASQSRNTKP